jgi:hypothetical protein
MDAYREEDANGEPLLYDEWKPLLEITEAAGRIVEEWGTRGLDGEVTTTLRRELGKLVELWEAYFGGGEEVS